MIGVLLLLALLAAFGLWLSGSWLEPGRLGQKLKALIPARAPPDGAALRGWAETGLEQHPALRAWLLGLPDAGLAALGGRLEAFCLDLNLRPQWLWNPESLPPPQLREVVAGVLIEYLEACRRAMAHQEQFALCGLYLEWVENLADARHRQPRRHLFTRLVEAGLAEPMPSYDLIMASEAQRQEWAAQAIRAAALKDWPKFAALAAEVRSALG
jgi:hypothetical protein